MRQALPQWLVEPQFDWYGGTPLFFDFETTNHSKGSALDPKNEVVCATYMLGTEDRATICWGSEYDQTELVELVPQAGYLVAHNAKFDLQWLERCGVDLSTVIVYDTMLAEYVIGGNRYKMHNLSLDACLQRRGIGGKLSVVSKMIKAGICPSEIPREWLGAYAKWDTESLVHLMAAQRAEMEGTRLLPVVYNRCLLTPVLADMERHGMQLDVDLVRTKYDALSAQHLELTQRMNLFTGGINTRSGKQLGEYLYDTLGFDEIKVRKGRDWLAKRTPGGKRATDTDTLSNLSAKTDQQREFKELYTQLHEVDTQLTKYMSKFNDCCTEAGGVLHASFNQCNTATHRLSSSGRTYSCQFQNFPRAYKPLFCAPGQGYVIAEVDGSQLEFRVAAHLGRDEQALEDIRNGVDVHVFTARTMTNAGQVTDRQEAKAHTFKPLYGGQSGTEAEKAYYAAFREKYPGIANTQQGWIDTVLKQKYLETEWGLRYYWPDTKMDRSGYITNTTSICNYPVQAFATAEIIPAAIVLMWHVIRKRGWDMTLVNTVHDSIIAILPEAMVPTFHALAKWAMIEGVYEFIEKLYGIEIVAPLGCGIKVATHWGATKDETKYEREEENHDGKDRRSEQDLHERVERPERYGSAAQLSA